MNDQKKVVIIPCSGIGKTYGMVSREAAYEVTDDIRQDQTQLVALSLLVLGDEETRSAVAGSPVITIDGCKLACATKMAQESGGTVVRDFALLDVYRRYKQFKPQGIAELNEGGRQLVHARLRRSPALWILFPVIRKGEQIPELPKKKVGIVSCSGEEIAEGTVTRLAALKVLEQMRPGETVTICLPLFLAGGEGDRAFARFYPTIAIDGCDKRCAARGTEMYSGKPAASIVVTDLIAELGLAKLEGRSKLNEAGLQAVDATAEKVAEVVDDLLGKHWDRRAGEFVELKVHTEPQEPVVATFSCGSGIPIQKVEINGQTVTLVAQPLIFEQLHQAGKTPSNGTLKELMEIVKIYNPIPAEEEPAYAAALEREYSDYCERQKVSA